MRQQVPYLMGVGLLAFFVAFPFVYVLVRLDATLADNDPATNAAARRIAAWMGIVLDAHATVSNRSAAVAEIDFAAMNLANTARPNRCPKSW
jgi:hypothetical protein